MKVINSRTLALTEKKDGKVVITGRATLSADGKHRTTTLSMTDPTGKRLSTSMYYDKQ